MTSSGVKANSVAGALAARLEGAREQLVGRWLDRIAARVALAPNRVFPTDELLDHMPLLITGIAGYIANSDHDLDAEVPVVAKAMELGALRHAQGFDAYEILKEYEILGAIIMVYMADIANEVAPSADPRTIAVVWQRAAHAIDLIRQATMTHFLRLSADRVNEREERLRRFNRMVAHELKNRVGAIRGAASLLQEQWIDLAQRGRFHDMIIENATELHRVLENLEALSRIEADSRQRRNVLLPKAIDEVVRQLRHSATANQVKVRVKPIIPPVEVDAAAIELCLMNYLTNAIKYSDRAQPERWIEIDAELQFGPPPATGELVIRVRDNGIGVPVAARARLFEQFYRAHGNAVTGVEGTGLGLSIVRETVESLGGRAWAEFPEGSGAVFAFALPSRREADAAAAGTRRPDGTPV